ncbi:MAG TPA: hypothetical protein VFT45_11065 [Longimicrobium sp.]|nr:hypothetical protein [Longimicrobium sp.]
MEQWTLTNADEQLKQIVRQANCCGPQHVVLDGEAVIVLSETEYGRLMVESLMRQGADSHTGTDPGLNWVAALRRPFEEAAARGEDVFWPWDWDCEKREWVLPVDHAVSP